MSSSNAPRKRNRVKLRCLLCRRTFDNDYKVEHNTKYHADYTKKSKLVPYEELGAVKNPFEAASASKKQRLRLQTLENEPECSENRPTEAGTSTHHDQVNSADASFKYLY